MIQIPIPKCDHHEFHKLFSAVLFSMGDGGLRIVGGGAGYTFLGGGRCLLAKRLVFVLEYCTLLRGGLLSVGG